MKKQLIVAVALGLATQTSAQMIWSNGVCPAWTATDITGVQHSVYDYLDEGYTVIMDFGATWCYPCWEFRNTERLDSLYTLYGPGTVEDKVMVFFIELDPSTDLADLDGTGDQTQGDWISGTPYPIIDDASIAQQLEVSGFPFMVVACPNRMLFPIANMTFHVGQLLEQISTCDPYVAVSLNDAAILPHLPYQQCAQESIGLTARLQNVGTAPLTAATIEAWGYTSQFIDTLLGSTEWIGDLATYEEEMVTVAEWIPTAGAYTDVNIVRMRSIIPDDRPENDGSTQFVFASDIVANDVEVTLTFLTDENGGETYWELHDVGDNIVASSSGTPFSDNTLYTYTWTLNDLSCYTLFFQDGGGNGLQTGYYQLQANGVVLLNEQDFHDNVDIRPFSIHVPTSINTVMEQATIDISPNPASDMAVVSGLAGARLNVLDVAGRSVVHKLLQADREVLPVSDLSEGVYTVMITRNGNVVTKRMVVAR